MAILSRRIQMNCTSDLPKASALRLAISRGNVGQVQVLLAACADLNATDHEGATSSVAAAENGATEVVGFPLQSGTDSKPAVKKFGCVTGMIARWHGENRMGSYSGDRLNMVSSRCFTRRKKPKIMQDETGFVLPKGAGRIEGV